MNEIRFDVKVIPKSSKSEIVGWENEVLKVKLNAVPEKGEANQELIHLLSKELKVPKSHISIIRGEKSRLKTIVIANVNTNILSNFTNYTIYQK